MTVAVPLEEPALAAVDPEVERRGEQEEDQQDQAYPEAPIAHDLGWSKRRAVL
jgi:hypothetical protein